MEDDSKMTDSIFLGTIHGVTIKILCGCWLECHL